MFSPSVSIIVPHKDNVSLLERLIGSIPVCDDFEVIVVDDHSSDMELARLQQFQWPYNAQLVLSEVAGGAGAARNTGLRRSRGTWVLFADSDDYFTNELHEAIQPFLESRGVDVVYFDVTSADECGRKSYRHLPFSKLVSDYFSGHDSASDIRYRYTPPWGKLFRREFLILNGLEFEEIPASNDIYFSIVSGHLASEIAVSPVVIYCVTQRAGSITNTISRVNLESKFEAALRINKLLRTWRKRRYQHSILYFMYRAWTLDRPMAFSMLVRSIKFRNNPFIGAAKALSARDTVRKRESR